MYSNQFTNTKISVQALSLNMTNAYSGYMLGKNQKIPSKSFSSTKMTWDILLHTLFSQQNEFYKVYNTKRKKKNHSPTKLSDFTASVPCRSIYKDWRTFVHCAEYITITYNWQKSRKRENLSVMLLGHHRMYLQWLQRHERCSFYSQIFTRSIQTGKFLW